MGVCAVPLNAIIHLVAPGGGGGGFDLPLPVFDEIARNGPGAGEYSGRLARYLMEDFYYAGGLRALMAEIQDLLILHCQTVNGKTLGENVEGRRK